MQRDRRLHGLSSDHHHALVLSSRIESAFAAGTADRALLEDVRGQWVAALAPHTVHTHVKDERGVVPNFEFLIPGEGEFDYVAYLHAMREHGCDDYITAEISIMVQRRPGYDPLAAAEQTYVTLARAFEQAGIAR